MSLTIRYTQDKDIEAPTRIKHTLDTHQIPGVRLKQDHPLLSVADIYLPEAH